MKNVLKAFGVIALVAIIGFSMAGCKNDDDDDGGGGGGGGGGNTINLSLNGTWESNAGTQINISGDTGYYTRMTTALLQDAINKGYISNYAQVFRSLRNTGIYTWSGQCLIIIYNTKTPNVAVTAMWIDCTITMSTNGQTITVVGPWTYQGSSGTGSYTWTRWQ